MLTLIVCPYKYSKYLHVYYVCYVGIYDLCMGASTTCLCMYMCIYAMYRYVCIYSVRVCVCVCVCVCVYASPQVANTHLHKGHLWSPLNAHLKCISKGQALSLFDFFSLNMHRNACICSHLISTPRACCMHV